MDQRNHPIAIVDDDTDVLLSAQLYLKQYFQEVDTFISTTALFEQLQSTSYAAILLDMNYQKGQIDGREGLDALQRIQAEYPQSTVVMMTAYGEVDIAVKAVKMGAYDFMVKPWQNEKLLVTMMNACRQAEQKEEVDHLKKREQAYLNLSKEERPFLGSSKDMQQLKELIMQVAPSEANVLIVGEDGSGKETIAHHLHAQSRRADQAFVKLDLQGTEANAQAQQLWGVSAADIGKVDLTAKGSLFVKEVAELDHQHQSKLLSGNFPCRLICTSTSTVEELIQEEKLRSDFMYLINTVEIFVPPLRERLEDLPELLDYYLEYYANKHQKRIPAYANNIFRALNAYRWPGNIRELQHAIERAVVMNKGQALQAKDLIPSTKYKSSTKSLKVKDLEQKLIEQVISRQGGNISKAAAELGLSRAALYRRMKKYGI